MTQIVWLTAYNLLLKPLEPLSTHWKLATLCRHIPNLLHLMSTCLKLGIPYVDTFETCYTLCQHIRNVLPYVDVFRTCYTLCRPVNILKQTLKVCRLNRPVQKVCTTNYTCRLAMQTSIQLAFPPFVT